LIRQGAKLVESAQDVWQELSAPGLWSARSDPPATDPEREDRSDPVLQAMGWEPCGLDQLQARCGWDTAALQAHLLALELDQRIARLSGARFQRLAPT
jgi:DNA processing protein